jgi:predicted phage tail protein
MTDGLYIRQDTETVEQVLAILHGAIQPKVTYTGDLAQMEAAASQARLDAVLEAINILCVNVPGLRVSSDAYYAWRERAADAAIREQ